MPLDDVKGDECSTDGCIVVGGAYGPGIWDPLSDPTVRSYADFLTSALGVGSDAGKGLMRRMTSLSQELRWAEDPSLRSKAAALLPDASEIANSGFVRELAGKAGPASIVLGFLSDLGAGDTPNQAIVDASGNFLFSVGGGGLFEGGCVAAGVASDGLGLLACGVAGGVAGSIAWEYGVKPHLNRALVGG